MLLQERALISNKTSSKFPLSTITENPLDQSSIISEYPSDSRQFSPRPPNDTQNSNVIISSPPFYTKRPTRKLPKMSKLKFLPKRKCCTIFTFDNSERVTSSMSHPALPITQVSLRNLTPIQCILQPLTTGNSCRDLF